MSRYLLAAILGLVAIATIYGIGNSQETLQRATDDSRDRAVSDSLNNDDIASIQDAGQNVTRQVSADGEVIGAPPTAQVPDDAPEVFDDEVPAVEPEPEPTIEPVQPVPPRDREAIPALW
ncbi:hypothetical protein PN498_12275 [Oscillatoria sp. CS-180]|uniref:hypothetical protein n=1 Tax=Oscillatoria sp. CS-180 TaxID=3021720 RepID=UPI00232C80CA|nr:hypothetical protein [Oscillatoria sp. CS-180]MDB9526768.1 hypothetical protein [Oscillatoria sp. CS-180]